jgi:hypothetical protein
MDARRKADAETQLADAERRKVVWDADPPEEDAEGENDPEFQGNSAAARDIPLGVRNHKGGEIMPIPGVISHGGGKHIVPGLNDLVSLAARDCLSESLTGWDWVGVDAGC